MRYRVHFQWPCGTEDSFVVEGETIQEIQDKVTFFFESRSLTTETAWSEEI